DAAEVQPAEAAGLLRLEHQAGGGLVVGLLVDEGVVGPDAGEAAAGPAEDLLGAQAEAVDAQPEAGQGGGQLVVEGEHLLVGGAACAGKPSSEARSSPPPWPWGSPPPRRPARAALPWHGCWRPWPTTPAASARWRALWKSTAARPGRGLVSPAGWSSPGRADS